LCANQEQGRLPLSRLLPGVLSTLRCTNLHFCGEHSDSVHRLRRGCPNLYSSARFGGSNCTLVCAHFGHCWPMVRFSCGADAVCFCREKLMAWCEGRESIGYLRRAAQECLGEDKLTRRDGALRRSTYSKTQSPVRPCSPSSSYMRRKNSWSQAASVIAYSQSTLNKGAQHLALWSPRYRRNNGGAGLYDKGILPAATAQCSVGAGLTTASKITVGSFFADTYQQRAKCGRNQCCCTFPCDSLCPGCNAARVAWSQQGVCHGRFGSMRNHPR